MNSIRIRVMEPGDIGFADSLRAAARWNQTLRDWERFLTREPNGCFIAEWDGQPVGTATTTRYGADLAWIGMLLVHPASRRLGAGTALLRHCLEYLTTLQIPCVKLDATPLGRPLYEKLEFQAEWPLARWEKLSSSRADARRPDTVRPARVEDLEAIAGLDSRAFGVQRRSLLEALAASGTRLLVLPKLRHRVSGFGMLRPGARAFYLGPLAAESPAAAAELVCALVAEAGSGPVFWDVPDPNGSARALAEFHGFVRQRPLLRMYRGQNAFPGDPMVQYGIAEPAVG